MFHKQKPQALKITDFSIPNSFPSNISIQFCETLCKCTKLLGNDSIDPSIVARRTPGTSLAATRIRRWNVPSRVCVARNATRFTSAGTKARSAPRIVTRFHWTRPLPDNGRYIKVDITSMSYFSGYLLSLARLGQRQHGSEARPCPLVIRFSRRSAEPRASWISAPRTRHELLRDDSLALTSERRSITQDHGAEANLINLK